MTDDKVIINHWFPKAIDVYPIADIHLGALEHAQDAWREFVKRIESDEDAYLILAGDLINNNVRGARFANPFDEVVRPREQKKLMADYLYPLRKKILCVVPGNHEARTGRDSDQDVTYDICAYLGIEDLYRQNIAFMRVGVGERNQRVKLQPEADYRFVVTHGIGGGRTGAAVNRDELFAMSIDGIDCLVTGHVHKGFITRPTKLLFPHRSVSISDKSYLITGAVSWLEYGGYAARAMLPPAETSHPQALHLVDDHHNKRIQVIW